MRNKLIKWLGGYTQKDYLHLKAEFGYELGKNGKLQLALSEAKKDSYFDQFVEYTHKCACLQQELSKANEQILAYEHEKTQLGEWQIVHYGVNDVKKKRGRPRKVKKGKK